LVYLERIDSASQRMGQLIRDLLELARGSHCDIKFELVDLSAIAGEIADGLRAMAPERTVQWEIAAGLAARGDPRCSPWHCGTCWRTPGSTPAG